MDWTVCSREMERDYTWDNTHASPPVPEYAQRLFAPAFEGSITNSRFVALLRCPNTPQGVMLCVSASTDRRDFSRTAIRTLAVLCAKTSEETSLLAAFFAECLRKSDTETLYDPESDIAKKVESLYQTKKPDEFLAFCRTLPQVDVDEEPVDGNGSAQEKGIAFIPRNDMGERQSLANALSTAIEGDAPFLFVLTDRLPRDVLGSLGSMFDHAIVRIFSKAVHNREDIQESDSQKYRRAAAIGGAVILVLLVAAIGTCSRGNRQDEAKTPTGGGTNVPSSRQVSVGPISPVAIHAPTQEASATNSCVENLRNY